MALVIDTDNIEGPKSFSASAALTILQYPIDLDASYPTGGYEILEAALALIGGFRILNFSVTNGTVRHYCKWDVTTGKLLVEDTAGVEIAAAVDLSAFSGQMEIVKF